MSEIQIFPVYLAPFDLYLFGKGEHWDLYRVLGAHPLRQDGVDGYRFAVWAPNAKKVALAGDFNEWDANANPLFPVGVSGVWAGFVPGLDQGVKYKFAIHTRDGGIVLKTDPFAFHAEMRPGNAAITCSLSGYNWNDGQWMDNRRRIGPPLKSAISVYEVHAGYWRWETEDYGSFLSYRELADQLIPYVKEMGFTHIEFMPLSEHPLDESWGYQTSHYYAPTSRFGDPNGLRELVDRCHQAGIGVLLDWVPGHFLKDDWGLARFDGTALFEHLDPRKGEHPDWGTYIFNYGRHEVKNFLFANALYWLKEFHFDGIRIDAVASMLYLDYSRKEGEWIPNEHGGRENLEAIAFLQELNTVVHSQFPGACMIAEESTSWPGVSRPVYTGGLGFTFKWNMGWMNDMLEYFSYDPVYRPFHHNNLTFSMIYAFTENFVLPISHDEVVHGKQSLLSKMPGDMWQKFANLRALLAYQWAHPGKKLLFMGQELGEWNEWSTSRPLEWTLLDFPSHTGIQNLVKDLNWLLASDPVLYEEDNNWQGFEWVDFHDYNASVISFMRKAQGHESMLWVFNLTPVVRENYCLGVPMPGWWEEVLNTDAEVYGGSNVGNPMGVVSDGEPGEDGKYIMELTLPPLAGMAFKHHQG